MTMIISETERAKTVRTTSNIDMKAYAGADWVVAFIDRMVDGALNYRFVRK